MVNNPYRMQSEEDYNRYLRRIYGGEPPTMDYYKELGRKYRERQESQKAQKQSSSSMSTSEALDATINELLGNNASQTQQQTSQKPKKKKELYGTKDDDSPENSRVLDAITGLWGKAKDYAGDVAEGIKEGNDLSFMQNFTRGAGNLIDGIIPFSDPVKDSLVKSVDNKWLNEAFGETEDKATGLVDLINSLGGMAVPTGAAYKGTEKALDATSGLSKLATQTERANRQAPNYLEEAQKGMGAGLGFGLDQEITEQVAGRRDSLLESLNNIALESTIGAVADPAIVKGFDVLSGAGRARRMREQSSGESQQREALGLPQPEEEILGLPAPGEAITNPRRVLQGESTAIEQRRIADEIERGRSDFEAGIRSQADELTRERQNLQAQLDELRENYVGERLDFQGMTRVESEWENVKQLRDEYDNVRKNTESFYIPNELREEVGHIVPRSFISRKSSKDIYKAAEDAGYEDVVEYANYLRRLQEAKNTRKKDIMPEVEQIPRGEAERLQRIVEDEFETTDDAQGIRQMIQNFDDELASLQAQRFEDTEDFQGLQSILDNLTPRRLPEPEQILNYDIDRSRPQQPQQTRQPTVADSSTTYTGAMNSYPSPVVDASPPPRNEPTGESGSMWDRGRGTIDRNTNMSNFDRTVSMTTDDLNPTRVTEKLLGREDFAMYKSQRVARGAGGASEIYTDKTLTPVVDRLNRAGKMQEGNEYLEAKHLLRVKELNPEYRVPGRKSVDELRDIVNRYENDPDIQEYRQGVRNYVSGLLDLVEDNGVINAKTRKELETTYPDYIPLYRSMDTKKDETNLDDVFAEFSQFNRGNVRKVVQELNEFGSHRETRTPIENLVQYGINAHYAAFNNRSMQYLKEMDGAKINGKTVAKRLTPDNKKNYNSENFVRFYEDGEQVEFYVNDDLKRSINNMKDVMNFDEITKFVHGLSKIQRQSITANPIFTIRQLFRDIPQAWAVGDFNPIDFAAAFIDSISYSFRGRSMLDDGSLEEFYRHGGGLNTIGSLDRSQHTALQRANRKLKDRDKITEVATDQFRNVFGTVLNRVRQFNEGLEQAPKLAQYRSTKRKTGDIQEAVYQGRDIMDFSRSGEKVRNLNKYIAFTNATIQGRSKQLRALKERPYSTGLKIATAGALPSLTAYYAYNTYATDEQKRIIDESPEWQRQTYWLFPNPNGEDVLRVPKPYEVAVMSSTPIEYMLHNENKVGTDGKDALEEWFNQAILIGLDMNVLTPVFEQMLNRDSFTGQEIVPEREANLPVDQQGDVRTSSLARGVANMTGISPRRVDHAISGYLPVASELGRDFIDANLEKAGLRENQAPSGSRDVPLISDYHIEGDTYQANELISNVYDTRDQLKSMKDQMQGQGQAFPYHNVYRAVREFAERDGKLTGEMRMIENDPNLSADEKAARLQPLREERNQHVRNAQEIGIFNLDESNLDQLEQQLQGLGASPTRTDTDKRVVAAMTQAGVPEVDANRLIEQAREAGLDDEQIAELVRRVTQNYQK